MNENKPKIIVLISGKRKSGKDYISAKLKENLQEKCTILHISEPLKRIFARENNLDYKELLTDSGYKEKYRKEMIIWSDQIRAKDPGYFCRAACEDGMSNNIWIVTDIRRKSDIKWFQLTYGNIVKTIRITANDDVRKQRGWIFTEGVDDVESECDLDNFKNWNLQLSNNNLCESEEAVQKILTLITEPT